MTKTYTTFYNEYKAKLFYYLLRKSCDFELSKDIVQETFTRHFQQYRNNDALTPSLLFTIARNALIDYQRSQNRAYQSQAHCRNSPLPAAIDEEMAFVIKEKVHEVTDAFEELPVDDQEVLSMAVNGLAYKHIAAILGLSESNTKIKIHRARKKLREKLSKDEEPWNI